MGNYFGVQRAIANVPAGSTDVQLVPGQSLPDGSQAVIRVIGGFFIAGGTATNITLYSRSGGSFASGSGSGSTALSGSDTAISPAIPAGINGGICLPEMNPGWFETLPGQALTVTTDAGATVAVDIIYVVVKP